MSYYAGTTLENISRSLKGKDWTRNLVVKTEKEINSVKRLCHTDKYKDMLNEIIKDFASKKHGRAVDPIRERILEVAQAMKEW